MALKLAAPIAWDTIEDAIADWVTDVLSIAIQWADQSEPQPTRPFASLKIQGPTIIGTTDEKRTVEKSEPDTWEQQTIGQREITLTVIVEAAKEESQDPLRHARALATHLQTSLQIDSITEGLEKAGLAFREVGPVLDISLTIANEFVNRASLEFRAGLASCVAEDIDVIEEIEGEGTVTKADGTTKAVPIELDSPP